MTISIDHPEVSGNLAFFGELTAWHYPTEKLCRVQGQSASDL
jgi:hypothetical protein